MVGLLTAWRAVVGVLAVRSDGGGRWPALGWWSGGAALGWPLGR
ncbi:hypothetical protein [Micromonospora cathayae]|uniref:Uncharacterized protein n=1 Tax=Micromonospora cathayae TaxID=3028804 RepID=A0ABY7ZSX2_9ACTN|nr:hypothetical protein [Micromonospora sp. HUAS 3]WDZ85257.1 hypothetical protein PVK37_01970 [Micromonospora sp. HUAS 3]